VSVFAATIPLAAGLGGGWLLRASWRDRRGERSGLVIAGWAALVAGGVGAALMLGVMPGIAAALTLAPLGVLGVVAQGATHRAARPARDRTAPEPLERPSRVWRGWVKGLLAGPLGMTAAMGIAFCYAVWAPGAVQTRLLIAALLVPALWGLAMTWTLADQRLLRSTAVLTGTSVLGFGLAFLKGIA
jgi:hypothetical protein